MAAKILNVFGGSWTLASLLREPPSVFYRLYDLAGRVQAGAALESLYTPECLQERRGELFVMPDAAPGPKADADQYAKAMELSEAIASGRKKVVTIGKITLEDMRRRFE